MVLVLVCGFPPKRQGLQPKLTLQVSSTASTSSSTGSAIQCPSTLPDDNVTCGTCAVHAMCYTMCHQRMITQTWMHTPGGSLGRRSVASGREGPGEGASTGPLGGPPGGRALRARRGREDEGGLAFSAASRRGFRGWAKPSPRIEGIRHCVSATIVLHGDASSTEATEASPRIPGRRGGPRRPQGLPPSDGPVESTATDSIRSFSPVFGTISWRGGFLARGYTPNLAPPTMGAVLWHSLVRRSLLWRVLARRVRHGEPLADIRYGDQPIPAAEIASGASPSRRQVPLHVIEGPLMEGMGIIGDRSIAQRGSARCSSLQFQQS